MAGRWIPVVSFGASDRTSGLYLDADTGFLGRWSRYNDGPGDELDTLVTYLEDTADMLETHALAVRDRPAWSDRRWCGHPARRRAGGPLAASDGVADAKAGRPAR